MPAMSAALSVLATIASLCPLRADARAVNYANRNLANDAVGGQGPMNTGPLKAGNANTCGINANAAAGYTPGQVYTITLTSTGEQVIRPSAGTITAPNYNRNT